MEHANKLAAMTAAVTLWAAAAQAARTDVIVLDNGDHITGEVIELNSGQLQFKTDHAGTLYIDWTHIVSLTTRQQLRIALTDGRQLAGQAPEAATDAFTLRLLPSLPANATAPGADAPVDVPIADIVELGRMKEGTLWRSRLEGDVSLGYSYTSANGSQTSNFSGQIGARTIKRQWNVALDSQISRQSSGPSTEWDTLAMSFNAFMPDRYYRESVLQFERNEALGLDLRTLFAQTFGRAFVQRQGLEWRAGAGLAVSTETAAGGGKRQALWLPLTTDLSIFRWDHPKINVTASLNAYPSLNEGGRVRSEAALKLRNELINDLYLQISFKDSYDNRPAESARVNDWNIVTSIGYSF